MFLTVFTQVSILMLLIFVGFFAAKAGILTESGAKCCTDLVLILVTPCVIIKSLIREFNTDILRSLAVCFGLSLAAQVLMILLSRFLLHSADRGRERVLRFGTIFANCGFMSLPLQISLLKDDGALYGSAYIIMFNLVIWSYGVFLMSGNKTAISPKKLIVNPGLIGLTVGIVLFVSSLPVPKPVYSALDYMSTMYTPLPMIIIGYHLSKADILASLRDPMCLFAVALRMLVYPFVILGALYLIGIRGTLLVSIVISVSAPVAAITTMFSSKYGGDTALSVNMVSFSTVLSIASMPLVITAAKLLA